MAEERERTSKGGKEGGREERREGGREGRMEERKEGRRGRRRGRGCKIIVPKKHFFHLTIVEWIFCISATALATASLSPATEISFFMSDRGGMLILAPVSSVILLATAPLGPDMNGWNSFLISSRSNANFACMKKLRLDHQVSRLVLVLYQLNLQDSSTIYM